MKAFKGKAIYNPAGRAGEYSQWACNFYTGCSNACEYCYCRTGIMAHTWSENPKLKKCFENPDHALGIFEKELLQNKLQLQEHGLFFSFTTDPMLMETYDLTMLALNICYANKVPVKLLTKKIWWMDDFLESPKDFASVGFTLTGHDELELNASNTFKRILAMKRLHQAGFKTWASIEPIVDFESSLNMIRQSAPYCNLFKVGLMSGAKVDKLDLLIFIAKVKTVVYLNQPLKIYWKDNITKIVGSDITESEFTVKRYFNLFKD
jgi:DNA repair photolyase